MIEKEKTFNEQAGITVEQIKELASFFAKKSVDEVKDIHGKTGDKMVSEKDEE